MEQSAAVDDARQRLLLVAPAGSGKTEVLARRIERLLLGSAGQAFRVLAVTYTVKAAEELRTRIKSKIEEDAWRVDCDTLHSFALEWLMRYGSSVGVSQKVIVFSDDIDRLALISDYLRTLGLESKTNTLETLKRVLKAIDDHRTLSPDSDVHETWYAELGAGLPELYDAYIGALTEAGGIDFPGMLSKLSEALDIDNWVLENFHRTYRHILVDEGQDLTPAQTAVLQKLAGPNVGLFVVADDRQAINEYAGGAFANARALVGEESPTIRLRHNFRCAKAVLQAAERVAALLKSPQESLIAKGAPSGVVLFEAGENPDDEAMSTRLWIDGLLRDGLDSSSIAEGEDPRVAPEDIAIVARTRWLLGPSIDALRDGGHRLSLNLEPSGFLTTSEGRLFFEAVTMLADPNDRPARRRFLDELTRDAPQAHIADGELQLDPIAELEGANIPAFTDIAAHLKDAGSAAQSLDTLLGGLEQRFANAEWRDDASALGKLWARYRSGIAVQQRSMRGFLRYVAHGQLARPTDPGIRVLTIHRVKGLEFKVVALVGVHEGALPDYRAKTASQIDAERRSLYVAMTRAQRVLRISWPKKTFDRWNRTHLQKPSRFLTEASLIVKPPPH